MGQGQGEDDRANRPSFCSPSIGRRSRPTAWISPSSPSRSPIREGLTVPRSHNLVEFEIEGPGEIVAVGNGDAASHEPFQARQRKAFNGLCQVIVKGRAGPARVDRAESPIGGAEGAAVTITHQVALRRRDGLMAEAVGFYTDTTVCIGCKACEVACHQWNALPARNGARCRSRA